MFWINVFFRWLHIAAAVMGVGGVLVMRFVLLPVLEAAPDGAEVMQRIARPFKLFIHTAIGLLLLSGIWNFIVAVPLVQTHTWEKSYHAVIGVKILLSLVLFTIAILLLKPVPALQSNRKGWLSVNVALGLLIMLLAAYLRRLWTLP